jgi:integrase
MPKDLDLKRGAIRIPHGKGDRSRAIGLDPAAFALVERWLEVRRDYGIRSRKSPVFYTLRGGPLKDAYVRALLPRLAKRPRRFTSACTSWGFRIDDGMRLW